MYAVIDLETTGGQPPADRITEIAIVRYDGARVVDRWQTLVNPERPIPRAVQHLTGIKDSDVADAPKFYEVAKQVVELTEGCVFVSHNSHFDYSFLKAAFAELGFVYRRRTLCTVRLSRKLMPGLESYSLGKLCRAVGIPIENRHRAMGDAAATTELLQRLLHIDAEGVGSEVVADEISSGLLPPKLDKAVVDNLPEATGVYYFHDEEGRVLYVGKSVNIRRRVLSHFQVDFKRKNHLQLKQSLADVTWQETGSELLALLLESDEIKRLGPPFNRAQRQRGFRTGIFQETDERGYRYLFAKEYTGAHQRRTPLMVVENMRRARTFLSSRADQFGICPKLMGLDRRPDGKACFNHQIKKCTGACCGAERPEVHNAKLQQALDSFTYPHEHFVVLGRGRTPGERSVVLVEGHRYRGFAYTDLDFAPTSIDEVRDLITPYADNKHVQAILRGYLLQPHGDKVIVWKNGQQQAV